MSAFTIVIVTGMSGAGRSTAVHVLEDAGFYCVDNLPPALAPDVLTRLESSTIRRVGFGIDVRTGAFLENADRLLPELAAAGHDVRLVFLDANDNTLVRRYSETRRPHPLAPGGDVLGAITRERERLAALRAQATRVFDTSELSVHELRRALVAHLTHGAGAAMVTRVVSFGFKYGLPVDADLVFDLRFLPNPYFVPELRPKTGLDEAVSAYVLSNDETEELLGDLVPWLERMLPKYEREGKAYLTVAIGCTGGRHRSVAVAEELVRRLEGSREVVAAHRDVGRGPEAQASK